MRAAASRRMVAASHAQGAGLHFDRAAVVEAHADGGAAAGRLDKVALVDERREAVAVALTEVAVGLVVKGGAGGVDEAAAVGEVNETSTAPGGRGRVDDAASPLHEDVGIAYHDAPVGRQGAARRTDQPLSSQGE